MLLLKKKKEEGCFNSFFLFPHGLKTVFFYKFQGNKNPFHDRL